MKSAKLTVMLVMILMGTQGGLCFAKDAVSMESKIENIMNNRRKNKPHKRITDQNLKLVDPNHFLPILERYENDPNWTVRRLAFWYEYRLAELQPHPKVRRRVVKRLTRASVSGLEKRVNRWLVTFHAEDFDEESKQMLRDALKRGKVNRRHVLICGVAGMTDQLSVLKKLIIDEQKHQEKVKRREAGFDWYYTVGWAARLARARMGVKEDIEKCILLMETERNLDKRVLRLLPNIGYIRQPAAIDHLKKYIDSNERITSVRPTGPGRLCAFRAVHILAESLRNFPVKQKKGRNYTAAEIDLCREWMAKQKEWDIIR